MTVCKASVLRIFVFFFFNDSPTTEIYTTRHTLSLHDALPISRSGRVSRGRPADPRGARCKRRGRSEEHTSVLQSRLVISYAVFCLKKKKQFLFIFYALFDIIYKYMYYSITF